LFGIGSLAALSSVMIDFQFYASTVILGKNNVQFFGSFYVVLNAVSLLLQLIVAPRLQSKFGIGRTLMLLPLVLIGSLGVFIVWMTVYSRTIIRITEGGIKASIHRSIWEQVYLPIDREQRLAIKALVDGTASRLSEGIGAFILFVWLYQTSPSLMDLDLGWISMFLLITILAWALLTRYLSGIGCSDIEPLETMIRLPDG
jgi:AAA family ATP:ADP antiporter